ncbi:S-layer homology domain-containing protein [Ureibacillus massiliensis]|uniref:S-layer homology domain-containing protein n=1 Tax=Ureibacillus massiliensis TaxID=292806 RepID=UPI0022870F7B|nr:S-layer homology domain-containing protein [Ureibacillus massiliensis]
MDKKSENQEDIIITINSPEVTLDSITNGDSPLEEGKDYTISDSTIVLKKEYLAKLPKGTSTLIFVFNEGEVQSLNLTVQDSTSHSSGGSSSKPQSSKEEIKVDVKTGDNNSVVSQTTVTRTKQSDGTVQDEVTLTEEKTKETITNVKGSGQNTASIVIPDDKDEVGQVDVSITKEAAKSLSEEIVNLEIYTENVRIQVPEGSLDNFEEDLYFRVIPIKDEVQRQEVESRARVEAIVKEVAGDKEVNVVSRPMTIETNLQSRPVTLILPLREVEIPTNASEKEASLADLVIFIEHSDGDKELLKPTVVQYKDGQLGLEFGITKFSTFTILNMEGWEDLIPDSNQGPTDGSGQDEQKDLMHKPYISGYGDMFRPNASITRAQMASMLSRNLEGIPSTVLYNDVKVSHWAYPLIMEAKGAGIMTGVNPTTFDPNGTVTRAQMAVIAYRWIENECKNDNSAFDSCQKITNYSTATFSDVSSKHWAIEAISFVKEAKVMVGYEDNTFRPNEKLTRAQAVVVLNNLFKRGPLTGLTTPTFKDVPTTNWAFSHIEEAAKKHTINFDSNGNEILK